MNTAGGASAESTARLTAILDDSLTQALGLQDSLVAERNALQRQDSDALDAALAAKSLSIGRLQDLDAERVTLGEEAGIGAGPGQMERLLERCDNDSGLAECWMQLLETAANCSTLNLTNGAIIQMRQQMIESSLAVLRGSDAESDTYKRAGRDSAAMNRRSLAQA